MEKLEKAKEALHELRKEFETMRDFGWAEGQFVRADKKHNDPAMGRNGDYFLDAVNDIEEFIKDFDNI